MISVKVRGHSVFIMRRQPWYLFGQGDGLVFGRWGHDLVLVRRVLIWCRSGDRCLGLCQVRDHLMSVDMRGHSVFVMRRLTPMGWQCAHNNVLGSRVLSAL